MWKERILQKVGPTVYNLMWYGAKIWVEQIKPRLPWTFPVQGWMVVDIRGQGTVLQSNPWDLSVKEVVSTTISSDAMLVAWCENYVLVAQSGAELCQKIGMTSATVDPILPRIFMGCRGMDVITNDFALGMINGLFVCKEIGDDCDIKRFQVSQEFALKSLCELRDVHIGNSDLEIEWME